jgi:hypothetical protein
MIADALRSLERARLRALVARDIEFAASVHAADFQLVTPVGMVLSKVQYLGAIEAGHLVYVSWDPHDIDVRAHERVAALRYRSTMQVTFGAHQVPQAEYWHTDLYEKRSDDWQVVWSQATGIQPTP